MKRTSALSTRIFYKLCCLVLFFVAAAASFNGFYDKWRFREPGSPSGSAEAYFDGMIDGTAQRPFVYRQMLPDIANWIAPRLPNRIKKKIDSLSLPDQARHTQYLIVYLAVFAFALLAEYGVCNLCRSLGFSPAASVVTAVSFILLVPYLESNGGYYYDYPEIAFLCIAACLAATRAWWWLIPLTAVATWNKESFLLMVPTLYPFLRRRSGRAATLAQLGTLCAVSAAVYLWLRRRFASNSGGTVLPSLHHQIQFILEPSNWLVRTEKTYGIVMLATFNLFFGALLFWAVLRIRKEIPPVVKTNVAIAAILNLPLYVLFCAPGEIRDLSMLYIGLIAVLAANAESWITGNSIGTRQYSSTSETRDAVMSEQAT